MTEGVLLLCSPARGVGHGQADQAGQVAPVLPEQKAHAGLRQAPDGLNDGGAVITVLTRTSVRKVFLLRAVAEMLVERKKTVDKLKELLGDEYRDYDLVFASTQGTTGPGIRPASKP